MGLVAFPINAFRTRFADYAVSAFYREIHLPLILQLHKQNSQYPTVGEGPLLEGEYCLPGQLALHATEPLLQHSFSHSPPKREG